MNLVELSIIILIRMRVDLKMQIALTDAKVNPTTAPFFPVLVRVMTSYVRRSYVKLDYKSSNTRFHIFFQAPIVKLVSNVVLRPQ